MSDVFDFIRALEKVAGDRELLHELAEVYLVEISLLMAKLTRAIEENDIMAAAKSAHTIKGASSNFCSKSVYDAAWQIEQMRPSNTAEEIEVALHKLRQETERLNQAIRKEFAI